MNSFRNVLALDTALGGCCAACVAGEVEAVKCEAMPRGQAEHLVPFADEVMDQCSLPYADLDAVLCTVGPGAFTGLRIGMSTARAFGLSVDVPVLGVTTLQALALNFSHKENNPCCVVLETKRQDFYVQSFDENAVALSESQAVYAEQVAEIAGDRVFIGDGVARYMEVSGAQCETAGYELPDMAMVARVLCEQGMESGFFVEDPEPVYLRGADVSMPKTPPRTLEALS